MMDKREIIKQLSEIGKEFHDTQNKIIAEHPDINPSNDARVTVFTNSYIVLDSIQVCLIVRSYEICEPGWWSKLIQENKIFSKPRIEALSEFLDGFNSFTMSAYLSLLSGSIESAFRAFHKAVFPSLKVPTNFECVCEKLFSMLEISDYLELLKLLRLLRNALAHNNGFHTHPDDRASWEDVSVEFRKGQVVDLGESGWKVMFVITRGILDMLKEVVNSNEIIEKPAIKDPSYD